jgi:DNA repair protein RadC
LVRLGSKNLSLQELLAVIISTGNRKGDNAVQVASSLLKIFDNNLAYLFSASIEELSRVEGIGFAKACQIKAVYELGKRIAVFLEDEQPLIRSTEDIVTLLSPYMNNLKQEEFRVILLDSKGRFIRCDTVSIGTLDRTVVEPRDVFRPAIAHGAASIIVVHNHPSGDPTPSEHDVLLTQELCICGKVLGIEVLDHVIIGRSDYASLKLRKLM